MELLVNPWTFYIIDVINKLWMLDFCILLFSFMMIVVLVAKVDIGKTSRGNISRDVKWLKFFIVLTIISLVLFIIVPDKKTTYKMLISSYVTTDNVQQIEDIVDKFIESR